MFERILERISISKYNKNFILKGGILLSAIFGINERSTKDKYACNINFSNILETIENILDDINLKMV